MIDEMFVTTIGSIRCSVRQNLKTANVLLQLNAQVYQHLYNGPYQVDWAYFRLCHGPKQQDMVHNVLNLTKTPDNQYGLRVNVTVLISGPIEELKTEVYADNKKLLYSTRVKNICKNFAFGPMLRLALKTDSNCVVKKGNYIIKFNLSEMTTLFLGPKFFYGTFVFKHTVISKKGNVFCMSQEMTFSKKTAV